MASLYKKVISGKPYWYLREMGWVDGKPKMVSERYVGTAADIEALLDAREAQMLPERTRHLDFGAVAAAWGLLADLGAAAVIDEETGTRPPGTPLSPGTYLALAALNRVVDPCSKRRFADWWRTTAADRFTKIPASALDHRRFRHVFRAVPLDALPRIEEKLALAACARSGLDTSSVALDMTTSRRSSIPATPGRRSRSGARPSRNARTCGWSASAWWSPATAASRSCPTPIPGTGQTSPSSRR